MPRDHHHQRQVQFYETDMAGIVHFSWYFRYMEEAEHALWRAAGLSIADPHATVGFPRVAATCDYKAPLHFEDLVDVHIRIDELASRRIRYACTIRCGDTIAATGTMTSVCIVKGETPMRATTIPPEIADRLTA